MASQQSLAANDQATLSILSDPQIDQEVERFESVLRERMGLDTVRHWVENMAGLSFTKTERPNITILIGGLTSAQDLLIQAAWRGQHYKVIALDKPDLEAFQRGKEFGNRSQCNPTYFTVGNLLNYLIDLRDNHGMTPQEICSRYVFLTAAACGPCRFGMYATEYRKALRDAGFDGFRVMLFQTQGGLSQATGEACGLEMSPTFFAAMLKGIIIGDVINGMGYRLRPYETDPGSVDKSCTQAIQFCHDALENKTSVLRALWKARGVFAQVTLDKTAVKPKVAIMGEFWAMTTEGEGNYRLQRFLEEEGCEVDIQFVTSMLLYNIWEHLFDLDNRQYLRKPDDSYYGLGDIGPWGALKQRTALWSADKALRIAFQTFAHVVGFTGYALPDMVELSELAAPHYNNDVRGGEGHLEVGKLMLNAIKNKANMTLSVKPFGCMPSSGVSDGIQSLITERFPGTLFCSVETSGDGAASFYSRVHMYLFKAKIAAEAEVEKALQQAGLSLDDMHQTIAKNPGLFNALRHPSNQVACTAANLVYDVARYRRRLQSPIGAIAEKMKTLIKTQISKRT